MNRHGDTKQQKREIKRQRKEAFNILSSSWFEVDLENGNSMFLNTTNESSKWVLLVHGLGSSYKKMCTYATHFLKLGYNTAILNVAGNSFNVVSNLKKSIQFAIYFLSNNESTTEVGIFAQSIGASAVIEDVYQYSLRPSWIILENPCDSIFSGIERVSEKHHLPRFIKSHLLAWCIENLDSIPSSPKRYVQYLKCPTLWIAGKDDWLCPAVTIQLMSNKCFNPEFHNLDGQHCRAMWRNPETYWNIVTKFLSK